MTPTPSLSERVLIPENADERRMFNQNAVTLGGPLPVIMNALHLMRAMAPAQGSYAMQLAIFENEIAKAAAEIARLQASELAWKLIAKGNDRWNELPQTEKEAALKGALDAEIADHVKTQDAIDAKDAEIAELKRQRDHAVENENRERDEHDELRAGHHAEIARLQGEVARLGAAYLDFRGKVDRIAFGEWAGAHDPVEMLAELERRLSLPAPATAEGEVQNEDHR